MSEIISCVTELKELDLEIKNIKISLSKLNKRKKELEKKVVDYLDKKDQPGLKYKDLTIISEEKDKHCRLKSKEKMEKGYCVLEKYGISNPEKVLKELMENMKGEAITEKKIKIKNTKNK